MLTISTSKINHDQVQYALINSININLFQAFRPLSDYQLQNTLISYLKMYLCQPFPPLTYVIISCKMLCSMEEICTYVNRFDFQFKSVSTTESADPWYKCLPTSDDSISNISYHQLQYPLTSVRNIYLYQTFWLLI